MEVLHLFLSGLIYIVDAHVGQCGVAQGRMDGYPLESILLFPILTHSSQLYTIMDPAQEEFLVISLTEEEANQAERHNYLRVCAFYQAASPYEIGNWINCLHHHTMPSYSFPLTCVQAYILHLTYYGDPLPPPILPHLTSFQDKINLFLKTHFAKGCFCKLTTRSPKDAMWYYDKDQIEQSVNSMIDFLAKENIKEIKTEITPQLSNTFYRFLLQAKRNRLLIRDGKQFITQFSRSDRIVIDLGDMSLMKGNVFSRCREGLYETDALTTVWCRQWREITWEEQFRCFYHDFTLTAISQYDQHCYFPSIAAHKQDIKASICLFFAEVVPRLRQNSMGDGVMDVIVKHNGGNKLPFHVELIEINVFNPNTRASLFKWDEAVLRQGPLQIRVVEEYHLIPKTTLTRMMGMIDKGVELICHQVCAALGGSHAWSAYS